MTLSRRGSFRLTSSNVVQLARSDAVLSEYELLTIVEQIVLRMKLPKTIAVSDFPGSLAQSFSADQMRATPDALLMLDAASAIIRQAITAQTLPAGISRLELLQKPVCYFEFRRERKEYVSFCHVVGGERHELANVAAALVKQFADARHTIIPDEEFSGSLKQLFAPNLALFAKSENQRGGRQSTRPELVKLCSALADHIFRHYHSSEPVRSSSAGAELESFTRTALMNWRQRLEENSCTFETDVKNKEEGATRTVQPDAPNCYPYVAIEHLDAWPGHLLVCTAGALDQWFVDDRVEDDRRLPEITLAVYDVTQASQRSDLDRSSLQEALRARLAGITGRVTAFKRGSALESAAGEASNIARYWFGEGVAKLLETNADAGGLETEAVQDFWARFVRDLLCVKIRGIDTTEVFPFDRAFIIPGSPADPGSGSVALKVRVMEAALQSRATDSRFQYLTSMERQGSVNIADLDVTSKIIKEVSDVDLTRKGAPGVLALSAEGTSADVSAIDAGAEISLEDDIVDEGDREGALTVDKVLRSLFFSRAYSGSDDEAPRRQSAERDVRNVFNAEGVLFQYRNGLDLKAEAPLLYKFDQAYKALIASKLNVGVTPRLQASGANEKDAKVVVVSYDPTLIQANRRAEKNFSSGKKSDASDYYVPPTEAFTLILLADDDPEKGVQDVAAERDDFRLLVNMILSQKMRDRRREAQLIARRVNVVESLVDSFLHRLGNEAMDRASIQKNWAEIRKAMRFDRGSLQDLEPRQSAAGYLDCVWNLTTVSKCDTATMEHQIRTRVQEIIKRSKGSGALQVTFADAPTPQLVLRLPLAVVKECLDVLINNAVEAALDARAPQPASLHVAVGAHPVDRTGQWQVEVIVENTTAPISRGTWADLTADTPQRQEKNTRKEQSTGVGVYAARQNLQSGLGNAADIRYVVSGSGKVQARLTLPAKLFREIELHARPTSAPTDVHNALDVLYVEDQVEFRREGEAFLKDLLPERNILTTSNYQDANRATADRVPGILIADMTILATSDADAADGKLGPKLVDLVMKRAKEKGGTLPPIWIVTAADSDAVKRSFRDLRIRTDAAGYEWGDAEFTAGSLTRRGTITILANVKDISGNEVVKQGLLNLFQQTQDQERSVGSTGKRDEVSASLGKETAMRLSIATLGHSVKSELLSLRRLEDGATGVLVVQPPKNSALIETVRLWFVDPGGVDPDSDGDDEYALCSSIAHRRVVLKVPGSGLASNRLRSRYWLMRHNAIVCDRPVEESAQLWSRLANEPNGPIGRLRHDILNIRIDGIPPSKFQDFESQTRHLEGLLSFAPEAALLLDQFADQPATVELQSIAALLELEDRKDLSSEVERGLRKLDASLVELPSLARSPNAASRFAPLRMSLASIQALLVG